MPPTCAAAGCAICRSPPPGISRPRWACPCSLRRMSSPEDNAKTVNRYLELAAKGKVDEIVELYAVRHRRGSGRRRGAHRPRGDPRLLFEDPDGEQPD